MCQVLMINLLMIVDWALFTLGSITLRDQKIKSNKYQLLCAGRLINVLVYFLPKHLNWIKRYSTMKIGHIFFVWVYYFFMKELKIFTLPHGALDLSAAYDCDISWTYSLFDNTKHMHCQDLSWDHSVSLCQFLRVIAIEWIECDHFCVYICIEISSAIF